MNWFQRHLNWTWVLVYLPMIVVNVIGQSMRELSVALSGVYKIGSIIMLISAIIMLVVPGWVIIQKGRSLWWLLLASVFSPLWLTNKKTGVVNEQKGELKYE